MKKLFISIVALAAFAACQSNFDDVTTNTPGFDNGAIPEGLVEIYAEVGVGGETKATYGDDMSAMWEENDQIALVQESANYNSTFNYVNALGIKRGAGTNSAAFWGDINVPTESPRIYHIAYPVSAVSFNTSSTLNKTASAYAYREDGLEVGHYYATASFDYTYNSTLNVTIPTTQSGKWEPYMYASTPEAVSADGIRATHLTTLTGAIAIRAYDADGTTSKKLAKVTISSANSAIAGAFSGTATSVGSLGSITGPETSDTYSTVSEDDVLWWKGAKKGREEAEKLLLAKVQGMTPTSVSSTKPMSLAFAGTAKTVTVENADVVADDNGDYVYYLNVAPFAGEQITIQAVAEDGTSLLRVIPSATLAASQRMRVKLTWEHAGLTNGSVETWYDSYAGNHSTTLAANKVYVNNVVVEGVEASAVSAIGALVYDLNGNLVAQNVSASNTLSLSQVVVDVPTSGTYNVISYARVTVNGQERDITSEAKQVNVTSIPTVKYTVQTSYATSKESGYTVSKSNNFDGNKVTVTATLSDSYIANNLAKVGWTAAFSGAGSFNVTGSIGNSNSKTNIASGNWGEYTCNVSIVLDNGYVAEAKGIVANVTGIPCEANWTNSDPDWSIVNASDSGKYIKVGGGKKGGVLSPSFRVPSATSINVQVAASGVGNKNRAMYVSVVDSSATSLNTSGSSMDTSYKTSVDTGTGYTTWTASVLSVSNGQKLSVAVYGGTFLGAAIYEGHLYKVKVEYK
ncbi:MAG: hypothetical protein J6V21_05710 [Alistipes sp.]|nr:hypothetical protein [Alistipes sp.]